MRLQNKHRLYVRVSWNEIHRQMREMARWVLEIIEGGRRIDIVVGVSRGGLPFAAVLARELNIRENIESIGVSSYRGENKISGARIIKDLHPDVKAKIVNGGENMIILDDLVDTGGTFRELRRIWPNALYATIFSKPEGEDMVDMRFLQAPQNSWIVFPWDARDGDPEIVDPISGAEKE
ncbi:MAG TPA: phosphoribosyltransferase family protein [Rhizomicrobium sp.]|jgi:xanthine phosphoribosyltransferase|nr:phosphoribosyltransferase family protein [Rhizomicrobium sp.]